MSSTQILILMDFFQPFEFETNTSKRSVGALQIQMGRLIVHFS